MIRGTAASVLVVPALRSMMAGLPLGDPITFAIVAAMLGPVALVACWLPSRSATAIDP